VDPFFHVTYSGRLQSIARRGLVIGAARSIGAAAYDQHAQRGVFVSGPDGVPYWYEKAQAFSHDGSDDAVTDGMIPVVLRIYFDEGAELVDDDIANAESVHADAWISPEPIEAGEIEFWDGEEWIAIDYWEDLDPELGAEWEDDDDSDDGGFWGLPDAPPLLPDSAQLTEL
jgi:hypothetical protein